MKRHCSVLFVLFAIISGPMARAAESLPATDAKEVLPVRLGEGAMSLQGDWKFKYLPSSELGGDESFFQPAFDVSDWATLPVPGHWELHGFAEPKYKKVAEGTGLYRHTFRVPKSWLNRRVFLRFDGVLYGLTVWVNGQRVGEWASSFNPVTFDVTDALRPDGDENVIAVRVTTRSKGWEFDTNDCWALSGIFRDVTLFATQPTYLADLTTATRLNPDGSATLRVAVRAGGDRKPPLSVRVALRDPLDRPAGVADVPLNADGAGETDLTVNQPQLWTAETPTRYRVDLELLADGRSLQKHSERIGLRQITIADRVLKLNGTPIKLRGVNHHDIWPDVGRAATEVHLRRDLEIIRAANINFIRTSHYPSHPRLIELCDELGIYVMCEVPFGFGDHNLTDPTFREVLFSRARATVRRDQNRPSVIVWSIGNENPVTELGLETARYVKELDPTRPVCIPTVGTYFEKNFEKYPEFVDIYAPHYPVISRLREYAATLTRPIIVTEYAHQLGLASDRVQDEWDIMQTSPRLAGGAIWHFRDQAVLRTTDNALQITNAAKYAWADAHRYYDTAGNDGMDGIIYADGTPQVDYWQVRKVYSPVQITNQSFMIKPGAQQLNLSVENRFDFRSLTGLKLQWSLQKNGTSIQSGLVALRAAPQATELVPARITLPDQLAGDVFTLQVRCTDETGRRFYERELRLDIDASSERFALLRKALPAAESRLETSAALIQISNPGFQIRLDRRTGQLTMLDANGGVMVQGIGPHAGRKFTVAEELRSLKSPLWRGEFLPEIKQLQTDARATDTGIQLRVRGNYHLRDTPDQSLAGEYTLLVTRTGAIEIAYDYTPLNATGSVLEAGLALVLPAKFSEFRWLGQGPYAGYPGKDRLNEFGLHHLTRDDIRFQGNRRGVELGVLASSSGDGVLLAGTTMELAVENTTNEVVLSQNALIAGRGNKGGDPETQIKAEEIKHIAGKFTLLPLTGKWPAPLTAWFGQPDQTAALQKPFYRSYDQ
jgi:beta-galactosidase